jgi:hypothetical protein
MTPTNQAAATVGHQRRRHGREQHHGDGARPELQAHWRGADNVAQDHEERGDEERDLRRAAVRSGLRRPCRSPDRLCARHDHSCRVATVGRAPGRVQRLHARRCGVQRPLRSHRSRRGVSGRGKNPEYPLAAARNHASLQTESSRFRLLRRDRSRFGNVRPQSFNDRSSQS